jgi:hypothetical protein
LQQQKIPRPQILVPQNISNFDFPIFFWGLFAPACIQNSKQMSPNPSMPKARPFDIITIYCWLLNTKHQQHSLVLHYGRGSLICTSINYSHSYIYGPILSPPLDLGGSEKVQRQRTKAKQTYLYEIPRRPNNYVQFWHFSMPFLSGDWCFS